MSDLDAPDMKPPTRYVLESLNETLYWFKQKLERVESSLSQDSDALEILRSLKHFPIDLPAELLRVAQSLSDLEVNMRNSFSEMNWKNHEGFSRGRTTELPPCDQHQLQNINASLNDIASFIDDRSTEIGKSLDGCLANEEDPLWDYEMDAELSFIARADDHVHGEVSDDMLTALKMRLFEEQADASPHWVLSGSDWPDGYEFEPMPHGRIFHELLRHSEESSRGPPLTLKEILRIGFVWCDVVVRYQFYYDITTGEWAKNSVWKDGRSPPERTYVKKVKEDAPGAR